MTFSPPQMTEEDQSSEVVPAEFKCDACRAVAYQLTRALDGVKPKPRSELQAEGKHAVMEQAARLAEAIEGACARETYNDYGIKAGANGQGRRLEGPGIEWDAQGMKTGGGRWPPRLQAMCSRHVEEHEEAGIADLWRSGDLPGICDADCGAAGTAPRKRRRKKPPRPAAQPSPAPAEQGEGAGPPGGGATKTGLEDLPPPPHSCQIVTRQNWNALIRERPKERKFTLVLFYDATSRSVRAMSVLELAARQAKNAKEKAVRSVFFGRYDSRDGDTHGYNFGMGVPLPKLLLFRAGYMNPKAYTGELNGPDDVIDWLRDEALNKYMKDDPAEFPRGEMPKSEL